ncbi:MAG: leucyl aminopeptidase [Deltaproteobacteria bacterium]|nr:leucyl aminopeptidase [Deltaproteobacteria bacterium]
MEKFRKLPNFQPKSGTMQFLRFSSLRKDVENTLFVGLGVPNDLTHEKLRQAAGKAYAKLVSEKVKNVCILVDDFKKVIKPKNLLVFLRAFGEGFILASYEFKKYKKPENKEHDHNSLENIVFLCTDTGLKNQLEKELSEVQAIGQAVNLTRDWSNEPSNIGTPEFYANQSKKLAQKYGLKCRILNKKDAQKENMGLFLGVGQGAEKEGFVVVLEYEPKGVKKHKTTIAFVGKGVTFDSGGISLKTALKMEEMKHDMTGAATVMGATVLASLWKSPNHIVSIMAFTENMPDGKAIQPGNILVSRSGKTVEVINTDAEGRLILGDALDFAQDFKPDVIIDAATLTGAVSIALGKHCCGVLGNDNAVISQLQKVGDSQGERIWQLPLYDEYFEDLKSNVADMKNATNDSQGGTIRAAIFLKQFIRKGTRWAHLDIASTATDLSHISYYPKKGSSGIYVRTLAKFAMEFRK